MRDMHRKPIRCACALINRTGYHATLACHTVGWASRGIEHMCSPLKVVLSYSKDLQTTCRVKPCQKRFWTKMLGCGIRIAACVGKKLLYAWCCVPCPSPRNINRQ